jgi:hypothetical protein
MFTELVGPKEWIDEKMAKNFANLLLLANMSVHCNGTTVYYAGGGMGVAA